MTSDTFELRLSVATAEVVDMADVKDVKYVVVGGGIAGVTCAETVSRIRRPS